MHLQFIVRRRILRHSVNLLELSNQAILVPVNESGMEGDGQIVTVLLLYHIAGMEGVAVAEQAFPLRKQVLLIVHKIFDLPGHDPCKLDFRMPVPGK